MKLQLRLSLLTLIVALGVFFAPWLYAQVAPIVGSTIKSTDTSATSLCVGCALGSSTASGGVKAGPVAASSVASTGAVTFSTLLSSVTASSGGAAMSATEARMNASTVSGASLAGYGTTYDLSLFNRALSSVLRIPANTTNVDIVGNLVLGGSVTAMGAPNAATLQSASLSFGVGQRLLNVASSARYNWYIGAQTNVNNGVEITPSTAVDGSTFTTPVFKIFQSGVVQAPTQPGFLAYNSANDTLQAGGATVDFDTEVYDEAGNFAADTFTAPVTGRYLFTVNVAIGVGSTNTQARSIFLITSNRSYAFSGVVAAITTDIVYLTGSVIADMDAADTASVQISLSSGTVTIVGDGTVLYTSFSGRLLP